MSPCIGTDDFRAAEISVKRQPDKQMAWKYRYSDGEQTFVTTLQVFSDTSQSSEIESMFIMIQLGIG